MCFHIVTYTAELHTRDTTILENRGTGLSRLVSRLSADRIRLDRYVHVWGNAVAAGSRGNEKSIFTGQKRKFQLDRTDFNVAEFIPAQLIFT